MSAVASKNNMAKQPYKRECKACHKWFATANHKQKYHVSCDQKQFRKANNYPRIFYYRRAFIMQRDNNFCQLCGAYPQDYTEFSYHVHHIDMDIHNNDWQNLITLCPTCHLQWHATNRKGRKALALMAKKSVINENQAYKPIRKKKPFLFKGI